MSDDFHGHCRIPGRRCNITKIPSKYIVGILSFYPNKIFIPLSIVVLKIQHLVYRIQQRNKFLVHFYDNYRTQKVTYVVPHKLQVFLVFTEKCAFKDVFSFFIVTCMYIFSITFKRHVFFFWLKQFMIRLTSLNF